MYCPPVWPKSWFLRYRLVFCVYLLYFGRTQSDIALDTFYDDPVECRRGISLFSTPAPMP
jgi:hypothetical protein